MAQIEFNRQCEDAWAKLIPSIEGVVVEDPYQIRSKVQGPNAAYSKTPALNYTIGRGDRSPATPASGASAGSNAGYGSGGVTFAPQATATAVGDEGDEYDRPYPPAPSSPAPPAPPAASNPFGGDRNSAEIHGVRKASNAFTDEEGEGGEDDVEEV